MVSDTSQAYGAQVNILGNIYRITNIDADVAPKSDGSPSEEAVNESSNKKFTDGATDLPSVAEDVRYRKMKERRRVTELPCTQGGG